MIKTEVVIKRAEAIRKKLEYVAKTIADNNDNFDMLKMQLRTSADEMVANMRSKASKFLTNEIQPVRDFLSDVKEHCAEVGSLSSAEIAAVGKEFDVQIIQKSLDFFQARDVLYNKVEELNVGFREINALTHDGDRAKIKSEFKGMLSKLLFGAEFCSRLTYYLESKMKELIDLGSFERDTQATQSEHLQAAQSDLERSNDEVHLNTLRQNNDVVNSDFFKELIANAKDSAINIEEGSSEYKESINLGNLSLTVTDDAGHKRLIKSSPILSEYLKGAQLETPFLLDLKTCGNILLEINESTYSESTLKFIHQTIISFLLSFPSKRLDLHFLDLDNKGKFGGYTAIDKDMHDAAFYKVNILRDDRHLENCLTDIEIEMHSIDDRTVARQRLKNLFEFNAKNPGSSQNFQLLVVLNYPKGFNAETSSRLLKVMENGNRAGIFTLLVTNLAASRSQYFKPEECEHFLKAARECSIVMRKEGDGIRLVDVAPKHYLTNYLDVSEDAVAKVFEVLQDNHEKSKHVSILLDKMIQDTDDRQKSGKIKSASEVIDIPVGEFGDRIQRIVFDTNGAPPHGIIMGAARSGKSNLLHTLILSACYKYSPKDLQLFLVDFKAVGFKFYEADGDTLKQLPHIRLVANTKEPEDGVAVLANVHKEFLRRTRLFNGQEDASIVKAENIVEFNQRNPNNTIPRILIIIDEVQDLIESGGQSAKTAIELLSQLVKQGGSFGISVLWASQNMPMAHQYGLRDKVVSQMSNRLSLKLVDPSNATEIGIAPASVKKLDERQEKGWALFGDSEFRVAYCLDSHARYKYVDMINKKWASEKGAMRTPLFIVGNIETPRANAVGTKYTRKPGIETKASYTFALGQDYISGESFELAISQTKYESRSNIWFAGSGDEEIGEKLQDMMGYSLLSVVSDNITNAEFDAEQCKIYYANGEMVNSEWELIFSLPSKFPNLITNVSHDDAFIDAMRALYMEANERSKNRQKKHCPIYFFINSLQGFTKLLQSKTKINFGGKSTKTAVQHEIEADDTFGDIMSAVDNTNERANQGIGFGSFSEDLTLLQMLSYVFSHGPDVNIRFVISMDNPKTSILANELRECANKVLLKGSSEFVFDIGMRYSNQEQLAFYYKGNELYKFKPYEFLEYDCAEWLDNYIKMLKEVRKNK